MINVRMSGGLGNQMFEYAFAKRLRRFYHAEVIIDLSSMQEGMFCLDQFELNDDGIRFTRHHKRAFQERLASGTLRFLEKMKPTTRFAVAKLLQALLNYLGLYVVTNGFIPVRFYKKRKNIAACGYFTSTQYLEGLEAELRAEFMCKLPAKGENADLLAQISCCNAVCVHIRRGDYVSEQHRDTYLVCTPQYYMDAATEIISRVPDAVFYVFSDDISWVREHVPMCGRVVYVDRNNPAYEDMRLMCACKHFILSNSTFSWWAQYLGDAADKIVISPDRWTNQNQHTELILPSFYTMPSNPRQGQQSSIDSINML